MTRCRDSKWQLGKHVCASLPIADGCKRRDRCKGPSSCERGGRHYAGESGSSRSCGRDRGVRVDRAAGHGAGGVRGPALQPGYPKAEQVSGLSGITKLAPNGEEYALTADGRVLSWGSGASGRLGTGSSTTTGTPAYVRNLSRVKKLVSNNGTHFALDQLGRLWSWGAPRYGLLGTGSRTVASVPQRVRGLPEIVNFVADEYAGTVYALGSNGRVYAWGRPQACYWLGTPQRTTAWTPVRVRIKPKVRSIWTTSETSSPSRARDELQLGAAERSGLGSDKCPRLPTRVRELSKWSRSMRPTPVRCSRGAAAGRLVLGTRDLRPRQRLRLRHVEQVGEAASQGRHHRCHGAVSDRGRRDFRALAQRAVPGVGFGHGPGRVRREPCLATQARRQRHARSDPGALRRLSCHQLAVHGCRRRLPQRCHQGVGVRAQRRLRHWLERRHPAADRSGVGHGPSGLGERPHPDRRDPGRSHRVGESRGGPCPPPG